MNLKIVIGICVIVILALALYGTISSNNAEQAEDEPVKVTGNY